MDRIEHELKFASCSDYSRKFDTTVISSLPCLMPDSTFCINISANNSINFEHLVFYFEFLSHDGANSELVNYYVDPRDSVRLWK